MYSEPGKGTTFKIYLPTARDVTPSVPCRKERAADLKGSETILLVEDNEQVRQLTRTILQQQGYFVFPAENGDAALKTLASHGKPVDLLLTDVVMPGMNGKELYDRICRQQPDIRVLYMSGYTSNVIAHRGVLYQGVHFIQKPFTMKGLAIKVREVLDNADKSMS